MRAVPKGTDEHMTDVVFEDFKEYYGKHCADKTENIRELIMYWIRFTKKDAGQQLYQTRLIMQ